MIFKSRSLTTLIALFFIALGGAHLALPLSEAEARPGSILRESRQNRTRTHKADRSRDNQSREDSSARRSRRSSNTNRARPTGPPRATGNTRPATPPRSQTRPDRHRHHPSARPGRSYSRDHRESRYRHRRRATTTRVHISGHRHIDHHHHHHYGAPAPDIRTEEPRQPAKPPIDIYLTLGAGLSGLAAPKISTHALPGNDFNLGVGAVGRFFGFEMGLHGGLFSFDPDATILDVSLMGLSTDLKLQPSLSFFEPYIAVGIGGHHLYDAYLRETALGTSGRLGAGIDLRISKLAISFRYQRNLYLFANGGYFHDGLGARTESLGINITFYH